MFKLIKLEIKKFKLLNYWKGVFIANLGFIAFLCMIYILEKNDGVIPFEDFEMAANITSSVVRATFIIFASVIIVKLVIDEFKNKSIDIMFTYPISRKKIMTAKLIIVVAFTFINVLLSTLFIEGFIYLIDESFDIVPGEVGINEIYRNILITFVNSLATAGMSLIPLLLGMIKKSASATIVSSIFIVTLTSTTSSNFTLFSIIAIPVSLGIIGLLIGYLSIKNIEKEDLV